VGDEVGNWVFCSAPLVENGRVWVLLRKLLPQPVLNAVCLDATSGRVLWNRRIVQSTALFGGEYDELQSLMLSAADGRLFCATNQGSVVALDARDGDILWVNSYAREESERVPDWHDRQTLGPNPCVCHDGLVFVAPTDSGSVLAFDGASGVLLWQRPVPGVARQVVGVSAGRLVVAANQLWGFDVDSGKSEWFVGNEGPDSRTRGRCLLSDDKVLWPREEEILVVDARAGRRLKEIPLTEIQRTGGGNLAAADGFLVCAQADRVVVFWEYLQRRNKLEQDLTQGGAPKSSLPVSVALALHETALVRGQAVKEAVAEQRALAAWQRVLEELPRALRERSAWGAVLGRSLIPLFLEAGQGALVAGESARALSLFQTVLTEAPRGKDRGEAGVHVAELLMGSGQWTESARVWNDLARDPVLVRLPRSPSSTRTIGQSAVIELARLSQLMKGDPLARNTPHESPGSEPGEESRGGPEASAPSQPCHAAAGDAEPGGAASLSSRLWTVSAEGLVTVQGSQGGERDRRWVLAVGNQLQCRDLTTGRLLWCAPLAEHPDWVGGTDRVMVLSLGSQLIGVDPASGKAIWSQPQRGLDGPGDFRRLECDGTTLVRLDAVRGVEALDLRTGLPLWRYFPGGGDDRGRFTEDSLLSTRTPGLSRFWCVREGIVAVQVLSPPTVCFLDLADGFLRQSPVPVAGLWGADPTGAGAAAWGVATLPGAIELLDGHGGSVQRVPLPVPEVDQMPGPAGRGGISRGGPVSGEENRFGSRQAYWTDGRGAFWRRDGEHWAWRDLVSGRELWSYRPRFRQGIDLSGMVRDDNCLYFTDGNELCAVEIDTGKLLWHVVPGGHPGEGGQRFYCVGGWLVVERGARGPNRTWELRDPGNGQVLERWQLRGNPGELRFFPGQDEVLLLTDQELAVFRVPNRL